MKHSVKIITVQEYEFSSKVWLSTEEFSHLFQIIKPIFIFKMNESSLQNQEEKNTVFYFYYENIPHLTKSTQIHDFKEFIINCIGKKNIDGDLLKNENLLKNDDEKNSIVDPTELMKQIGDSIFGKHKNEKKEEKTHDSIGFSPTAQKIIEIRRKITLLEKKILDGNISLEQAAIDTEKIAKYKKDIEKYLNE